MYLSEFLTKLIQLEQQLIEKGIDVEIIKVSYYSEGCFSNESSLVTDIVIHEDKNLIELI